MTTWEDQARRIIQEYAECRTTTQKIQYLEYIGDKSTDLAVWEEILRFAMIGAVRKGVKGK